VSVIIATGPSVEEVELDFLPHVRVITVNGALHHAPRPCAWITCDARRKNRERMARPIAGVEFYAAVRDDYGQPGARHVDLRAPPEEHVKFVHRRDGDHHPLRSCPRLSEDPGVLHGGNSAYVALGLAYLQGVRFLGILGLDGTMNGYAWDLGWPIDLTHLDWLFSSAVPQLKARGVQVVNGSPGSRVTCFPRTEPQEVVRWLNSLGS
jgi:hypothetical protein